MTTWLLTPAFSPLHQGFHKVFILHTPTQAVPYFFDQNYPQNIGLLELLHHMFPSPYATVIFQIDDQDMFEGILENCCGWRFSVGYQDWSYRSLWSELKASENLIFSCIWRIIVSHKTDGGFFSQKFTYIKTKGKNYVWLEFLIFPTTRTYQEILLHWNTPWGKSTISSQLHPLMLPKEHNKKVLALLLLPPPHQPVVENSQAATLGFYSSSQSRHQEWAPGSNSRKRSPGGVSHHSKGQRTPLEK